MTKVEKKEEVHVGFVDIKLRTPIKVTGVPTPALRMREPIVDDQLTSDAISGTNAEKEIALYANLCTVTPAEIKQLTQHDYNRLQRAYLNFIV